jgi:hypothetical protein
MLSKVLMTLGLFLLIAPAANADVSVFKCEDETNVITPDESTVYNLTGITVTLDTTEKNMEVAYTYKIQVDFPTTGDSYDMKGTYTSTHSVHTTTQHSDATTKYSIQDGSTVYTGGLVLMVSDQDATKAQFSYLHTQPTDCQKQ